MIRLNRVELGFKFRASKVAQRVRNLPAMQETQELRV